MLAIVPCIYSKKHLHNYNFPGSRAHSSSTLNSEENHPSLASNSKGASNHSSSSSSSNLKPHVHRTKETLLSRLTQQFSRVLRPHKEIEWQVKRSKLNKIIYEQTDKFLTCPYKVELDGGKGVSNPKLTLYVHPYGIEEDSNENITLEISIETPTRPKSQRMDSRAEVEVKVRAEDGQKKIMIRQRAIRESLRLNYFLIKGFVSHEVLKHSHSDHVAIIFSASLNFSKP